MAILGIKTVGVAVRDVKLVARFFYEKLDCEIKYNSDSIYPSLVISLGDNSLILYQVNDPSAETKRRNLDLAINPPGFDHVVLRCDNLLDTYHDLKSKGVVFDSLPEFYPQWGFELAHFRDPEDNGYYLLEVIEELPYEEMPYKL